MRNFPRLQKFEVTLNTTANQLKNIIQYIIVYMYE